jgi:hypothetical protein
MIFINSGASNEISLRIAERSSEYSFNIFNGILNFSFGGAECT